MPTLNKKTKSSKKEQQFKPTNKTSIEIEDRLIRARISLLISAPFFGNLATRLRFVDATKWCPTAATDGRNIYYNRNFVDALSDKEIEFLVGHEVLHCVYDHLDKHRLQNRDPYIANIAQDFVINNDLKEAKIGKLIELIKICYDPKHSGKFWEEIYDELIKDAQKSKDMKTLDVHLDQENYNSNGNDESNDGSNGPIIYNDSEKQNIKDEFQNAVLQSAKIAGNESLPQGVKNIVNDLLNPRIDWRKLLSMQIKSIIKNDYTMSRPSRKGLDAGFYLPSMDYEDTIDIAVGLDASGSICDNMRNDFLSEIKGIMEQYTNFKIHLFCFDTAVHNPKTYNENNISEFLEYEVVGGGGTDFDCCFEYMKNENIVPKKFIMFTDGYPWNSWGDEKYCETLFLVHSNDRNNFPVAPFGITVPYDSKGIV